MKIDYKTLAIGAALGYAFREAIGQALGGMKKEEAKVAEDLGALHLGALQMNPNHLGALQMNPAHLGALQMNPQHMGALQMGAIHQNPHSAFDQTQASPHGARGPWGYGALHLGALARH